jgi:hypothetical protein
MVLPIFSAVACGDETEPEGFCSSIGLISGSQALERCPRLDQRTIYRKVLGGGQFQLARLRYHGAEKLARHVVFQQALPIAAKAAVVEARLVPVQIQEPAEQKAVIPNSNALLLFEGANKVLHAQCTDNV